MNGSFQSFGPALMSAEAREILAHPSDPLRHVDAESLPTLRKAIAAFYEPGVQRALTKSAVRTRETVIAGVPCLEVLPQEVVRSIPILYGYGGGFITGSPREDLILAAPLAATTGARVIIPAYRLAPEHPWPTPINDGFAVYHALAEEPFALVGESAGGNLALCCLLRAQAEGLRMPVAMGLLSPWCDLTHGG